jgi:tetratricopeptide (TPR) repeat protein
VFRLPRLHVYVLSAALLLNSSVRAADHTVVVGIRTYAGDPRISVPRYSDHDAAALQLWLTGALAPNVVRLQNAEASLDRVILELRTALLGAHPGDTIYLFLSARGLALPRARNGFIETAAVRENKPESTALSISDLADMIDGSPAARVYFLADLCRDSDTSVDNRINQRIQERLGRLPKVRGILASAGSQASLEGTLPSAGSIPAGGYGYFAYFFVKSLVDRDTAFRTVYKDVARDVAQRSSGVQKPAPLGPLDDSPLWGTARRSGIFNPSRLALFFLQQAPAPPPVQDPGGIEPAIARVSELIRRQRWDEAAASVRDARASLPPKQWTVLRDRGMVAAADLGQEVVARYGTSDLLPGDPEQLVETDFVRAARAFETALTILGLVPLAADQEPIYAPYRASLTARRLFAEGRTAAFHPDRLRVARDLLVRASAVMSPPIPEISNALGITYLENPSTIQNQRTQDIRTAIRYFQESSALSPTWSYPRHNLALAYLQLGDSAAAERAYADAAAASPPLPYLYFNLGLAQQRRNRLKDARQSYERALDLSDRIEASLRSRAVEWQTLLPADSQTAQLRAEIFHRNRAEPQNAIGVLMAGQKHWSEAAHWYGEALASDPEHCPARHNLALLELAHSSALEPAPAASPRTLLEQNTAACPAFEPSWIGLGDLQTRAREWPAARYSYERALQAAPSDPAALKAIGDTYEGEGNRAAAADYYARAARAYEDQPGGSPPLAPPQVYVALIRALPSGAVPCDLYDKASAAQRSIGGLGPADRKLIHSHSGCVSGKP